MPCHSRSREGRRAGAIARQHTALAWNLGISWFLFPALLAALSLGCGLACERAAGIELARPLLPAIGLATVLVVGQFTTLTDSTAELTVPVLAILALSRLLGRALAASRCGGL